MSQEFLNRNHHQDSENDNNIEHQKKIDPVAQLKWINSQQLDAGWGLDPVQMFGRVALESKLTEPSIQMKPEEALHNVTESLIQAQFVNPEIQGKSIPINSNPILENEADVLGKKAAQGKAADVIGRGSGVQRQTEEETTEDEPENNYESYKSKAFKTVKDAFLSDVTEKDDVISVSNIYSIEKKFELNLDKVIPKGLRVLLIGTDFSYEKSGKSYIKKEVARVKIVDDSNSEWNTTEVWTTRTNVSTSEDENGLYKIIVGDANVRESAVEVDGAQKSIPKDSELIITDYKKKSDTQIYLKVANKETKENYGWVNANAFGENIYNESFGIEKATYVSEDANHSTINKKGTVIYKEENNYNYTEYLKEGDNYVLIPNNTKIKITNSDGNFSEVEGVDGTYYGWTSNGNYKTTEEADILEINDPDARLRIKQKTYTSAGMNLNVGDFVITKGVAENNKYTKIAQTEKENESYTEKADSDGFVLTENLTGKWANVKGKHATWVKGRYTGQIDLVSTMGASGASVKMRYMKGDSGNSENDMFAKYLKMAEAAESDGVIIELISGFRTYPEQKYLDDNENEPGFNTAATPGYSPHQNGIAIDINSKHTEDLDVNKWLMKNSYRYGFVKPLKMGYEEAHHWEYKPNNTREPETITEEATTITRYYFGTWSPDKAWSDSDAQKWYATYYDE